MKSLLSQALKENHHIFHEDIQAKWIHYLELLQTWNRVFNLTAITRPRDSVYRHIIDSLTINSFLHGSRILDVGSGAGMPGIPLAIIHPDKQFVLLDKNSKKTRFMVQAIAELGLKNIEIVHARCEDFHPTHCFDSILSRAFGTIRLFVETTQHLLCAEGIWIAMKGKYPDEELKAIPDFVLVKQTTRVDMKGIQAERHIVCLQKQ